MWVVDKQRLCVCEWMYSIGVCFGCVCNIWVYVEKCCWYVLGGFGDEIDCVCGFSSMTSSNTIRMSLVCPLWCRWLAYLPFTQDTRVRVPVREGYFATFASHLSPVNPKSPIHSTDSTIALPTHKSHSTPQTKYVQHVKLVRYRNYSPHQPSM